MQIIKVCFIGEAKTGKTTLINAIMGHDISNSYIASLGADLYILRELPADINTIETSKPITLHFFDVASSIKYSSYRDLIYEQADIFILVYDVTKRESLQKLYEWVSDFTEVNTAPRILCGSKKDKFSDQEIVELEKNTYVKIFDANDSLEVSAFSKEGINHLLTSILTVYKNTVEPDTGVEDNE